MNTQSLMTWADFKAQLTAHPNAFLQFEYAAGDYVDAAYHITEIKQAPITSVDCGGVMNAWTEIIVQLWEPDDKGAEKPMRVNKAFSIIDVVENSLPLNPTAIVKIEFGNSEFDTRQMYPNMLQTNGEDLVVSLVPDATQCKAISRGGSCGPVEAPNSPSQLATVQACSSGSDCC